MTLAKSAKPPPSDAVLIIAEQGSVAIQLLEAMAGRPRRGARSKPLLLHRRLDGQRAPRPPRSPPASRTILSKAQGTAPAEPLGPNYDVFNTNLMAQFGISGTSSSFLAEAYDATYVGAYGVVYASKSGSSYDGMTWRRASPTWRAARPSLSGRSSWPTGKDDLVNQGSIDITGHHRGRSSSTPRRAKRRGPSWCGRLPAPRRRSPR